MIRFSKVVAAATVASLLSACGGGGQPAIPAASVSGNSSLGTAKAVVSQSNVMALDTGFSAHVMRPFRAGISISGVNPTGASSPALTYHGGPVQVATKIYVVFWGKTWKTTGDPKKVEPTLLAFYKAMAGHAWINSQTQYTENGGGHVGNPATMLAGSYIDGASTPPKHPSDGQIATEASRAAAHFKNYTNNASYIVAMPTGVSPSGFGTTYCAYHSDISAGGGTISYTNLPYMPDQGSNCGAGSVNKPGTLDGVTIVSGHEQAETMTDPQPSSGWSGANGETGDLCAWVNLENNPDAGNYPTQPLWSNAAAGCVQSG